MAQKQISDLTATDRLRTGSQLELQDPVNGSGNITIDNMLLGPNWDTPSQIAGYTAANIMEVEANTLAARMRLCPDEVNLLAAGWQIGRYMWSSGNYPIVPGTPAYSAPATAPASFPISLFGWACMGGFAVVKKVTGSLLFGARGTGLAGACSLRLHRVYGLSTQIGTTVGSIGSPGSQGGSGLTGLVVNSATTNTAGASSAGSGGLKTNQQPSQAHIQSFTSTAVAAAQGFVDAQSIGIVEGSAVAAAGSTAIQNGVLYDWQFAEQPLVLTPGTGFQVNLDCPGATSQTIWQFVNIQWDEWLPVAPGDR